MKNVFSVLTILILHQVVYSQGATCATATAIAINGACDAGTVGNISGFTGLPYSGCSGIPNHVGYYTFTTGASPENITVSATTNGNLAVQVFSGTCAAGSFVGCSNVFGGVGANGSSTETVTFVSTPFTTYIWQVINVGGGPSGSNLTCTTACVTSTPFVLPNDEPCSATPLAVNSSCSPTSTTNIGSTGSAVPSPGCAGYLGGDVWYTVTVPASGQVTVDTDDQTILDGGLAIYSGPNCSTLTLLACDNDNSANGLMGMLTVTGQTPGATLWIRVWENGNDVSGPFGICAYYTPPASPQDCQGAIPVCSDASYAGNSSGFANQELNAGNRGCLSSNEHQTTWFVFSPQLIGTIQLNINPTAGAVDYDFAVWGPYNPGSGCPVTGAPLRCSYAAETGTTGLQNLAGDNSEGALPATTPRFVNSIVITAAELGKIYYLVVDNYSANTTPFTLDWTLSTAGMLDCTPLPVELVAFEGNAIENVNQISWSTQSEANSNHFVIEKSIDAQNYTDLKIAHAAGNSNELLHYMVVDANPYPLTYYRLKQVDNDGGFVYYGPISIANNNSASLVVQNIYPNPASEVFKVDLYCKDASTATITVYDAFGRTHYSSKLEWSGATSFEIPTSSWNSGVYNVVVTNEQHQFQHIEKLIIK